MPRDSIRVLGREWHSQLATLVRSAREQLVICSPFVGAEGVELIERNLTHHFRTSGAPLVFLTNLSVRNILQSVTDPSAVLKLSCSSPCSRVYHLPGLHAKTFVADDRLAIVTSGNLTAGGLYRNYECGVLISSPSAVKRVSQDALELSRLGALVTPKDLESFAIALESIAPEYQQIRTRIDADLVSRFRTQVEPIEDALIRLRLSDGPIHTVFGRTIQFLLERHGALTTVEIHDSVSQLHPDLCDNTVDRVIDGKRFGKKWKHAVRTAQQQLKKKGLVEYVDGQWRVNVRSIRP